MAWQSAAGMNYLHLSKPPILHRDFKSMNLLVDANATVKICDFGLSCVKTSTQKLTEIVGSPFWMAPEVIQGQSYDGKADVYSFGVCCFEMMTGAVPFGEVVTQDSASIQNLQNLVCSGKRAPIPSYVYPSIAYLISECWAQSSDTRPTFENIIPKIEGIAAALQQQPPPSPYANYYYNPQYQQYQQYSQYGYYAQQQASYHQYQQQYQQYSANQAPDDGGFHPPEI